MTSAAKRSKDSLHFDAHAHAAGRNFEAAALAPERHFALGRACRAVEPASRRVSAGQNSGLKIVEPERKPVGFLPHLRSGDGVTREHRGVVPPDQVAEERQRLIEVVGQVRTFARDLPRGIVTRGAGEKRIEP